MRVLTLNQGWMFTLADAGPGYWRPNVRDMGWLPARVPGTVQEDLVSNGIIADPFQGLGELGCQWVGESDWNYRLEFDWSSSGARNAILRFECLDTVCSIFLNGDLVAVHDNFFVPLEVDVRGALIDGRNVLEVHIESAVKVGERRRRAYFDDEALDWNTDWFDERAFVRKPAYSFGWDWGPRLVTCGIAGSVSLLEFDTRLTELDVLVTPLPDGRWSVRAETDGEASFKFLGSQGSTAELIECSSTRCCWHVQGELWWPRGYGDQVLHRVAALGSENRLQKTIGFRTIQLVEELDDRGKGFAFVVNGSPIYAMGTNWIPNSSYTLLKVAAQIEKYAELNFNMLRVWGGGAFESDEFYDACDRLGLMVWQDFPFACSYYPDHSRFREAVSSEAEVNVKRLRHHPSLALWCGNNECHQMAFQNWSGSGSSVSRFHGRPLYEEVVPSVLQRCDPGTPYVASSPAPSRSSEEVNVPLWGDEHYWNVWHGQGDWTHYEASEGRFASEFGFASSCSAAQWETCLSEGLKTRLGSPEHLRHDKTGKPWDVFTGYVESHYPKSFDLEDWVYHGQLNQRDALRHAIEHFRRSELCKGTLIWQANDCWPVQSWSVEDYLRLLKPAGFELARLYASPMISLRKQDDAVHVFLVNDSPAACSGVVAVEACNLAEAKLFVLAEAEFELNPGERRQVSDVACGHLNPLTSALRARVHHNRLSETWRLLAEPKNLMLREPGYSLSESGGKLVLAIEGVALDLVLCDPDDPFNLVPDVLPLAGQFAQSVCNGSLTYRYKSRPCHLRLRSLAGKSDLSLGS